MIYKNTFTLCTSLKLLPFNKICHEIVRQTNDITTERYSDIVAI